MAKTKKTILNIEVTDRNYRIRYNGSFFPTEDKTARKHNERIISMLATDENVFNFFYRLIDPVIRYKRRQARRQKPTPSHPRLSATAADGANS